MPKTKKKTLPQETEEKIEAEIRAPKSDPVEEKMAELVKSDPGICNHQNLHYTAGELRCVLNKGHDGDHAGYVGGNITAWSDAAGVPIKKQNA